MPKTTPEPIYAPENVKFAYQLRWGVTIFWKVPIAESVWLERISQGLEVDGIRILSTRWIDETTTQLSVSTLPLVSPELISQRIKGRLQHAIRLFGAGSIRQHFALRSYGSQSRKVVERYVFQQSDHHRMAAHASQKIFDGLRYYDKDLDLTVCHRSTHGHYWYNLHIVLVNKDRWRDVNSSRLKRMQSVLIANCRKKDWKIRSYSVLADHSHFAINCPISCSPARIVLSLMNNIAWCYDMKPILYYSAFVATFGEYDQGAIQT